jgi:mRNA interferase MazF
VTRARTPAQRDLLVLSFDPRAGHEQKGRRPALVISNRSFNRATGLAIVCPITNTDRPIPFHVAIPEGTGVTGFAMVEQVKAVDYSARRWKRIGRVKRETIEEVLAILDACFE